MSVDRELEAMKSVSSALEALDDDERARVIAWAIGAYGGAPARRETQSQGQIGAAQPASGFRDFPDLFDAANPHTEADRALVAAYWIQVIEGQSDFDAQTANTMLKDMGHSVSNITSALSRSQRATPALVRQIHKAGTTKQARKRYRLTTQGIRYVEGLLSGTVEAVSQ